MQITAIVLLWIFNFILLIYTFDIPKCRLNNGDISKCVFITDCPSALKNVFLNIYPVVCGENNEVETICCPDFADKKSIEDVAEKFASKVHNYNNNNNENKFKDVSLKFVSKLNEKTLNSSNINSKPTVEVTTEIFSNRNGLEEVDEMTSSQIGVENIGDRAAKACSRYMTQIKPKKTRDVFQLTTRIQGGEVARLHEFPHMALLGYPPSGLSESVTIDGEQVSWRCGGSLISEYYVLTAAHCVAYLGRKKPMVVRLGDLDWSNDKDGAHPKEYGIKRIILYPEYEAPLAYHDIALIELDHYVEFNSGIRPACLPKFDEENHKNKELIISGWGDLSFIAMNKATTLLMKAQVKYVPSLECNRTYMRKEEMQSKLPRGLLNKGHLCAQDKINNADTCKGDSGGPLQVQIQSSSSTPIYEILGVTSVGKSCSGKLPTLYVKVVDYLDWIEDIVWPYSKK